LQLVRKIVEEIHT